MNKVITVDNMPKNRINKFNVSIILYFNIYTNITYYRCGWLGAKVWEDCSLPIICNYLDAGQGGCSHFENDLTTHLHPANPHKIWG